MYAELKHFADSFSLNKQIIVGGGTAGLALATRLSQSLPYDCILVDEVGPYAPDEPKINIPGLKGSTIRTSYDWNFTTVPQPDANNRSCFQNRGRVLGGSSAFNLMTWDRDGRADYDAWEELGNPGWNWDAMLSSMLKAENIVRTEEAYGQSGVGYGGSVQAPINEQISAQQLTWILTMETLGLQRNLESLGGNLLGVVYQPSNIRWSNYTRSYSTSYLPLAGPNFHIVDNSVVTKVNTWSQSADVIATGVTLDNGSIINATKEVILSAGSLISPNLLELSGIGRGSVLTAARTSSVLELPGVGENLQDHVRI